MCAICTHLHFLRVRVCVRVWLLVPPTLSRAESSPSCDTCGRLEKPSTTSALRKSLSAEVSNRCVNQRVVCPLGDRSVGRQYTLAWSKYTIPGRRRHYDILGCVLVVCLCVYVLFHLILKKREGSSNYHRVCVCGSINLNRGLFFVLLEKTLKMCVVMVH